MSIPNYQTVMLPLLRLAAGGEQRVINIVDRIADEFQLSEEERAQMLPNGRQRILHNRIHWAKFYMTKARLLSTTGRGKFVITELGQELLNTNPPRIDLSVLMHYQAFREFYKRDSDTQTATLDFGSSGESAAAEEKTPLEQIEIAHQKIHAGVRADLLDRILQNSPAFFEQVIVDLLVAMGYGGTHKNAAAQLGRSGDGGVDGVINEDRLGLDRVYVQAKRYADATVSRPDVQSFVGSLVGFGATKGVFVTTSAFSAQAREYVKNLPQRVILLDGQKLVELMIEHNVGVRTSTVLELKALDENFFDEDR